MLGKVGQSWPNLAKLGQTWPNLAKLGQTLQSWAKLAHCLLRKPNFFLVCQQKIGILRLFFIFFIKSKRNRNKLWSCFRNFQVSSIFQEQLHNLFRFSQKSSKEAKTLPKNVCLDWHTENNLKRPSGTV